MTEHGESAGKSGGLGWFLLMVTALLAATVMGWFAAGWETPQPSMSAAEGVGPQGVPSDEEGLRALSRDPTWVSRGKEVYGGLCWTCHGQQGEGTIQGPSLRDERWIIEPSARNILGVIRDGREGTAMQAMRDWYGAEDLAAVAAYVAHLARQGGASETDPEGLLGPLDW